MEELWCVYDWKRKEEALGHCEILIHRETALMHASVPLMCLDALNRSITVLEACDEALRMGL